MEAIRDKGAELAADEAAEWLIRLSGPDVPVEEHREFIIWLKRSPVHLSAYLGVERTWASLGQIDPSRRIDVAALLAQADANVVQLTAATPSARASRRARSVPAALAACALIACVGGLVWFQLQFANRFSTGVGEQRTLKLSDGSTVVLNTDTSVRVNFSDSVREVRLLDGEALFNVAKNRARPFRVRSEEVVAQAVGTSFVVRRKSTQTVVTVIEGEVAVVDIAQVDVAAPALIAQGAVHVSAGTRADVVDKRIHTAAIANPAAVTSWRSGRLIFDGEPLLDVIAEFNRYNDVQLVLEDSQLSGERISGVFDADQPLALARFLERSGAIEPIRPADGKIALVPQR